MADGRHIENRLLAISPRFIVPLTRNLVCVSRITVRHRSREQNSKFRKFKMADGRPFENFLSAIISCFVTDQLYSDHLQFRFKKHYGCAHAVFTFKETMNFLSVKK